MKKLLSIVAGVLLSVSASAATIPVLMYHKVTGDPTPTSVPFERFKEHMQMLKAEGYRTITVSQLAALQKTGAPLPEKTVALTFDDGWKDNIQAAKLLKDMGMTATFYLMSGAFNSPLYMNIEDARFVSKHFEVGAHTHTHFMQWEGKLDQLPSQTMVDEIALSRVILQQVTGQPINSFAWPFGYYRQPVLDTLPILGFESSAMVDNTSQNASGGNPMVIPRINVDGKCSAVQVKSMVQSGKITTC